MNTDHHRERLAEMYERITAELSSIAVHNEQTDDWEVLTDYADTDDADQNAQADASEDADERIALLAELETRYRNIVLALQKIDAGTYGVCEVCGSPIEEQRLEANPAARTCVAHLDAEVDLPL